MGTTESAHTGIETDAPDRSWEHVGCFELGDRRATLEKFLLPDRDMTLTVRYLPPTTEGGVCFLPSARSCCDGHHHEVVDILRHLPVVTSTQYKSL